MLFVLILADIILADVVPEIVNAVAAQQRRPLGCPSAVHAGHADPEVNGEPVGRRIVHAVATGPILPVLHRGVVFSASGAT
jgi:hypothetical protein